MPNIVNDDALTTFAFNQCHGIGFVKIMIKDNQITVPISKLVVITNKNQTVMNAKRFWNAATARSPGATWAALCSHLGQVFIQL